KPELRHPDRLPVPRLPLLRPVDRAGLRADGRVDGPEQRARRDDRRQQLATRAGATWQPTSRRAGAPVISLSFLSAPVVERRLPRLDPRGVGLASADGPTASPRLECRKPEPAKLRFKAPKLLSSNCFLPLRHLLGRSRQLKAPGTHIPRQQALEECVGTCLGQPRAVGGLGARARTPSGAVLPLGSEAVPASPALQRAQAAASRPPTTHVVGGAP